MNKTLKILFFPFAFTYGFIIIIRNLLYDFKVLRSEKFNIPLICIGNLSTGGTGKSPITEAIIKILHDNGYKNVVTLSRGYGRKTKGYFIADENSTADIIGDEPLQFYKKFRDIKVVVCENRSIGIKEIIEKFPETQCILLDDAYQHRRITAGLNILLTEYSNPFFSDFLLPSGRLREPISGKKRADIIIITKTPENISEQEKQNFIEKLKPYSHQKVFFSFIKYLPPVALGTQKQLDLQNSEIILFTGIANPIPLKNYLEKNCKKLHFFRFPDHHIYQKKELTNILNFFANIASEQKAILTTEKDFVRLINNPIFENFKQHPFYYISIEMDFFENDKQMFHQIIKNYVGKN